MAGGSLVVGQVEWASFPAQLASEQRRAESFAARQPGQAMSSHLPPGGHCDRHEQQLDEIIESFGSGVDSAKRAAPNASMPRSYTPFVHMLGHMFVRACANICL